MKIEYSYGSSRGNKVWINCFVKQSARKYFNIAIELNKDKSKSKINWIVDDDDKDLTLKQVHKIVDRDFINEAYEYAITQGYTKRWA